jgi:splicing factor 3B subunit 2
MSGRSPQTKPRMSPHGDLYFEGKEFEVKLRCLSTSSPGQPVVGHARTRTRAHRHARTFARARTRTQVKLRDKQPGVLSDELKRALKMKDGYPPPWLKHMQECFNRT